MKIVFNCIDIWSVDLFLIKDKAPGRKLIKMASLQVGSVPNLLLSGAVNPKERDARCKSRKCHGTIFVGINSVRMICLQVQVWFNDEHTCFPLSKQVCVFCLLYFACWWKNSSMELAVIWGNFTCSDLACSDLACSSLACSDLGHSDLAHSDLARSDLAHFFVKILTFFT